MEHIRVVVADDHPIMRSGIRALLVQAPDIAIVGEATTGVEALRKVRDLAPDVLLLDLEMPEMRGDEVARRIQQDGLAVRVLVLSAYDDESHILALLESGVAGYLTKAEAPGSIVDAVRGVARGGQGWFSRDVTATVMQARTTPHPDVPGMLSPRERQVLILLARGYDNPRIAGALDICEGTVKNHVTNIYDKLRVRTRAEAVAWAWQQGLADDARESVM